ncbi:MAG: hypothetical protein FWF40_02710 [Methanomassiliicoccaceae archaeon]|nr:hypothetical protein [Methanomassiliicoccaceae archaeon]
MNDKRTKLTIAAAATALFILSAAFAILLLTDEGIREDLDRLFMYMAAFLAAFIILNVVLAVVAVRASKRLRTKIEMKRCTSCSATIPKDAETCPKCRAVQPMVVPENAYLKPRYDDEKKVKPKK